MKHHEHRGVSLGTIVMLAVTLAVLITSANVLPRLMGKANISVEELAMRSSVNMNGSLPSLVQAEIPIVNATEVPPMTAAPTAEPQAVPTATAVPEITAEPAPVTGGTVNLTFGGSIVVDDLIRKSGYYSDSEKYDYTDTLSLIAGELDSDLSLVTLETVIDPDGNVRELPNAPATVTGMLRVAGIDVAALGYNRAAELGMDAVISTIAETQRAGIGHIGAYATEEDAAQLRIYDIDNVRVALLHYTSSLSSASRKKLNSEGKAFAIPVASIDTDAPVIAADIQRAKDNGADIVIVSLNWSGESSLSTTSSKSKEFMQTLADAGADVIVGAGTKTVREITWIMGKRNDGTTRQTLCAWSLGSLLNGERKDGNVTGMLLHLQLSYNGSTVSFERVTYTPTYIWRYKQDGQWRYRVVASDLPAPDGMDSTQADNAARSFENLKKTIVDSPVVLRTP